MNSPCFGTQEEALGEGTFSTVFRCRDATTAPSAPEAPRYAVKFTRCNEATRRALEWEVKIMSQLITKVAPQETWIFLMKHMANIMAR